MDKYRYWKKHFNIFYTEKFDTVDTKKIKSIIMIQF